MEAPIAGSIVFGAHERAQLAAEAEATIAKGSKSFAAAARLFAPDLRASAMMLYAWCRHCDDVVDDQILGHRQGVRLSASSGQERLAELEARTLAAIDGVRTGEAPFDAIGDVVHRHALPTGLVLAHLEGFRMDVGGRDYETIDDTLDYCYAVAGVVGVMMARVMGVGTEGRRGADLTLTLDRACDLGLAFQLTNIARDLVDDSAAGRVYVPGEWLREEGLSGSEIHLPKKREAVARIGQRLVDLAEPYYASASQGLAALPPRAAWAVATAAGVYRDIGMVIRRRGAAAWDSRASTSGAAKILHAGRGAGNTAMSRLRRNPGDRPQGLWTRPRMAELGERVEAED
ncbi:phytoene/squalene synthase family protein [Fulvimarina endophytica]|uniref:Phytoene/squalene synthase family protein n=2 Tax=Fulvimarina endophytica TaxID=2293836 RepID=A0A371X1S1_9HYPH|nr:phytoene/squalene synthase family protein [Fulvimarina endophytica]